MTDYRSFDRSQLIARFCQLTSSQDKSWGSSLSRKELIEQIKQLEAQEQHFGSQLPLAVHRTLSASDFELPFEISEGQRIYFSWESDPIEAAWFLDEGKMGQRKWNIKTILPAGTKILTVLATTPPMVACLESVNSHENREIDVARDVLFTVPISLNDVEELTGAHLPRASQWLKPADGISILDALGTLLQDPRPLMLTAGTCRMDSETEATTAIHTLALIQRKDYETRMCDGCQREVDATSVHFFRDQQADSTWDIQEHVDDIGLLCNDCHQLLHAPTLKQFQGTLIACPQCGARNPKKYIWGMPAFPPDEDEYVIGGCCIPDEGMPEYSCRECETCFGGEEPLVWAD
ncbi:hypothetical protein [Glutamicibacter sp.]|uniref:hypothetical protein n=1 Tax=Glutamicibacter sp. TaxID=1931995 RepID=UPI0028BF3EE7|nr:hypothetical protein [Glutamicibacter sp.]